MKKTKHPLLLIVAGLILCLSACKKDNTDSIVGTWFVNKLNIQQKTVTTGAIADTTYTDAAFNAHDYFQFNNNGTASVSSSGIFNISGKTTAEDGNGNASYGTNKYVYSISGSVLTLSSTLRPPTICCVVDDGPATETIIQLNATNLVLKETDNTSAYTTTTVTYYTRKN